MPKASWPRFAAACATALCAGLFLSSAHLRATDEPPPMPQKDLRALPQSPVLRVVTGDTVVVRVAGESLRISLLGVVAAPLSQPFGPQALRFLENLLAGESVYVELPAADGEPDRLGRQPAYLFRAPDGLFVNLELVRQGYAAVAEGAAFEHRQLFEYYSQRARSLGKGQWTATPATAAEPTETRPAKVKARQIQPGVGPVDEDVAVYITGSGKKYHRADCAHLRTSATPIALKDAKARGYEPCATCKPPE